MTATGLRRLSTVCAAVAVIGSALAAWLVLEATRDAAAGDLPVTRAALSAALVATELAVVRSYLARRRRLLDQAHELEASS